MLKTSIIGMMAIVEQSTITVESHVFNNNGLIPEKYTCEGQNINPPLTINNIPENAVSLALIMDDPDAPNGTFDHWIVWNISNVKEIKENSIPGIQGKNGRNENSYTGPCPPEGTHHYHFKIYALDNELQLEESANKKSLENAMDGHIVASGELVGLYKRKK